MVMIRKAMIEDETKVIDLVRLLLFPSGEIPGRAAVDWQMAATTFREMAENDERGTILVAEQDGDIAGLITLSYAVAISRIGLYASIEEFIVSERVRGLGIGGDLIEAAIAAATSKGCHEILVIRPTEQGYPVYLRHGFRDIGRFLYLQNKLLRQATN